MLNSNSNGLQSGPKRRQRQAAIISHFTCIAIAVALAGCSMMPTWETGDSAPAGGIDISTIKDAVPKPEPRSRSGNPPTYSVRGKQYQVMQSSRGYAEQGVASWYGTKFHGRRTSSGETYDMYTMTAAHKSLPLPTYVRVTNLRNGRSAVVKVNDRGPFHDNRVIDLSYAAATKLGIASNGTGLVEIQALDPYQGDPQPIRHVAAIHDNGANLFIQVGAFADRSNANRMRQRLQNSMHHPIRIQLADSNTTPLFRVQVGPMQRVEQTDAATMQLSLLGIRDMHMVIE